MNWPLGLWKIKGDCWANLASRGRFPNPSGLSPKVWSDPPIRTSWVCCPPDKPSKLRIMVGVWSPLPIWKNWGCCAAATLWKAWLPSELRTRVEAPMDCGTALTKVGAGAACWTGIWFCLALTMDTASSLLLATVATAAWTWAPPSKGIATGPSSPS